MTNGISVRGRIQMARLQGHVQPTVPFFREQTQNNKHVRVPSEMYRRLFETTVHAVSGRVYVERRQYLRDQGWLHVFL